MKVRRCSLPSIPLTSVGHLQICHPDDRRLRMRRDCLGECEVKCYASAAVVSDPQTTAMRLNDRATDGQPHTSAVVFSRKECPEDLVRLLARQSHTRIADRDLQLAIANF